MAARSRKAWGTFLTVTFLLTYCLVAMAVGGIFVVGLGPAIELAFYVLAGIAWLPPAMAIIRWMARP